MLSKLIEGSVRHRTVAILVTIAVALVGVFSFLQTPIEAFPDVTNLQVNVIAQAPGLAPEEVELQVTIPLERALNGIPGATLMRSESLFGLALVWIVFEDGADGFRARTHVMERLLEVELPDNVHAELAPDYTPLGKVLYYRLQADHLTPTDLRTIQETTVERALRQVPGVADVIGFGGYLKEIHAELVPELLQTHDLTIADVLERVERSNQNAGGGFLAHGDQEFVIRSIGTIQNPDDIRAIVLRNTRGVTVTLGDVANIYQSYTPRRGGVSADNDDEIVQGIVLMRRGENPNTLLDALHARIDSLNSGGLPDGVHLNVIYDRGEMVGRTLGTVYTNLWHGAVLIIAVCWLFLRILRGSLIVSAIIPLALLTAFIGLYQMGLPANLISMGAIDFGILVDGAVVLVENIQHHLRQKRPQTREEVRGIVAQAAIEVARPTFFAMAIIIAAMLPIFSLQSVEGRIFRPLALTYVFALLGALVFSLTAVPALCAVAMRPSDADVKEPKFVLWLQARYHRSLLWLRTRAWIVALAGVLLLLAAGVQASRLGSEFLPELDEGDIYVFAEAPPSIGLNAAAAQFGAVRRALMTFPEVMHVLSEQGRPEDGTDNEGVNVTKIFVRLHPSETWASGRSKAELIDAMRDALDAFPGIAFNFSQPIKDSVEEAVSGVRGQVVLKVQGRDFDAMRETLQAAIGVIHPIEGVTDLGLYRDTVVPQLRIDLDRAALARHGILVEDAQIAISTALAGTVATTMWEGEFEVPIRVRTPLSDRSDIGSVSAILIPDATGAFIPLSELADVHMAGGRAAIPREQNTRYLALKFNIDGRDAGSVIRDAMRAVEEQIDVPSGLTLEWGGEFENQQRAMARLQIVVPLALAIVLILLVIAMRSIPTALIVLVSMPFGMAGGFFGLGLANEELSVSAAIGFIALIGQVSLLGLLMLTSLATDTRSCRETGTRDGVAAVASERVRALLMTALLASLGLLPMAMSTGMGSETQRPFAIVIVGGMITTLMVALFAMPLLYERIVTRRGSPQTRTAQPALASALIAGMMVVLVAAAPHAHAADGAETLTQPTPVAETVHAALAGEGIAPAGARLEVVAFEEIVARFDTQGPWAAVAASSVRAAEAGRTTARAFEDPTLSYELAAHVGGTDFVDGSQHAFLVEWEAPLRRIRRERSAAVAAEVAVTKATLLQDRAEYLDFLRELWAEAAQVSMQAEQYRRLDVHLEELAGTVRRRVAAGVAPPYDEAMLTARQRTVQTRFLERLESLVVLSMYLAELVGEPNWLPVPSPQWTSDGPGLLAELEGVTHSPAVVLARAQAYQATVAAQQARLERTPTLVLSGGVQLATQARGTAALGGVSARLPIFGAGRGAVQKADAEREAAEQRARWEEHRAEQAQRQLAHRWTHHHRQLERLDATLIPQALQVEALARRSYIGGVVGFAELSDALEALVDAYQDRADAVQELVEIELSIRRWLDADRR